MGTMVYVVVLLALIIYVGGIMALEMITKHRDTKFAHDAECL